MLQQLSHVPLPTAFHDSHIFGGCVPLAAQTVIVVTVTSFVSVAVMVLS